MKQSPADPNSLSLPFIEGLYADFLENPSSVAPDWRRYFEGLPGNGATRPAQLGPTFRPRSLFHPPGTNGQNGAATVGKREIDVAVRQDRVDQLVRAYRVRGHIVAKIDPLGQPRGTQPELEPKFYGFTEADLAQPFSTRTIHGPDVLSLGRILRRLQNTYCRWIGVQFMHIDEISVRDWLQERMERTENRLHLERDEQLRILTKLTDAVVFEEFLQKRYPGAKSFSLEGAESLIPLLDLAIEKAGEQRINEVVLAMAHRGRLNVLANIIGKSPQQIFREYEDVAPPTNMGHGDVKYHLGYSSDWVTQAGHKVHLSLCFNPSHLEFVNPVALGRMRAKQDRAGDTGREHGMVLLIHGDAAFAGEGVSQETLSLSQLEAYTTGGTIHVIVNNQIGFTTSPSEARSSTYATDVARMLQIPIFHVNGENPEAVAQVVRLAMDFRLTFRRDVVIDMYCFRRRGHNEGDEPAFTQPVMYDAIENRESVREAYLDHLLTLGEVTVDEADRITEERRQRLDEDLSVARSEGFVPRSQTVAGVWGNYQGGLASNVQDVDTGVDRQRLAELLESQARLPADFHPHPKIARGLKLRQEMARGQRPLDWTNAEALAFASLAVEGTRIRMSGQDTRRGTFSQRHSVFHDVKDGHAYMPLAHLAPDQAPVEIYNSPLSETGVLGFEYGYSLDAPDGLVLWEAQFGDFVNAAQVIIDQFITSAEDKWRRLSGLVLLLPHGFEGMGPEHSSGRLERFLGLGAAENIQVVNLTTPAQYFHCLRRQVLRPWRKPLVIMTPKSLLRHPAVVSTLDECATGRFRRVIADDEPQRRNVKRVLLCSGKLYYDLAKHREDADRKDVAIVRVEELYPLPSESLKEALVPYADKTPAVWVQEEPENMGAWWYMKVHVGERLLDRFPFSGVYRPASASPATGSANMHKAQQQKLIAEAFGEQ
ncbi:MAG: 2-oxoglutarate dehydrogenase E1 component [Planctomycetes bacterium]|nr:2-oxoglutarate dehydrogenase E1 component [Planctomycetota bacterium]